MCGCDWYTSVKSIHSSSLSWRDCYLKNIKYLSQNSQNRRSGEMANWIFETYKTIWWRMGVISMQQHLKWTWRQCVYIHHPNMHCHTGNVCCMVVPISQVLIFQSKNHIGIITTHLLKDVFIFITQLHVVQCMENSHWTKRKCVAWIYNIHLLLHFKNYTQEKNLLWWRHLLMTYKQVYISHQYKIYNFTFHIYAL